MASQKFVKGTEQFQMFTDYWSFRQEYFIPEESEDWWDEVVKKADEIARKYNNDHYIRDLLMAHIADLERRKVEANR